MQNNILNIINELTEDINTIKDACSKLSSKLKSLEENLNSEKNKKEEKTEKEEKKTKRARKPSGFAKEGKISEDLCAFMGIVEGSLVARTEVTKFVIEYIKNNNLQDLENKKKINPDNKLKTLLSIGDKDELTYFNIQKKMNPHFLKI